MILVGRLAGLWFDPYHLCADQRATCEICDSYTSPPRCKAGRGERTAGDGPLLQRGRRGWITREGLTIALRERKHLIRARLSNHSRFPPPWPNASSCILFFFFFFYYHYFLFFFFLRNTTKVVMILILCVFIWCMNNNSDIGWKSSQVTQMAGDLKQEKKNDNDNKTIEKKTE